MIKLPDDIESLKVLVLEQDEQIRNYSDLLSYHIDRQVKAEDEVQRLNATSPAVSLVELVPDEMPQYIIDELEWRSEKKDGLHCYHMENAQRSWDKFRVAILRNIEGAK